MSAQPGLDALGVDASALAKAEALAKLNISGDEIIEMSIKPSLWYIPVVSFRVVTGVVLLAAAALGLDHDLAQRPLIGYLAGLLVLSRLAFAALQWASRVYVLTNRRVIRFSGVLSVTVLECPLRSVSDARLFATWYQALLRLGSVVIERHTAAPVRINWAHIAQPRVVHEKLLRAIQRAQSNGMTQ